jgi:lipoprotein NlpI
MRFFLSICTLTLLMSMLHADEIDDQFKKVRAALNKEDFDTATKAAEKAIELDPKGPRGHFIRGEVHSAQRKHLEAIKDYEKAHELDKKFLIAINQRGGEYFKLGKLKESLDDFDAYLKENPKAFDDHWRRGITLYYLGIYGKGAKQFKAGEKVFGEDVENAFWHYLCNARGEGVEKARKELLKVGLDARIPMMKVYDLIQGKCKAEEVIEWAEKADETRQSRNERLFYAHLYVGLNYEAERNPKKCREHLEKAVEKHKIGHYMWDVANVHLQLLKKKDEK